MLSNLKNLDAIAFTRLDRLSRNVLEANKMLELLQQNNVAMISICEDDINTSTANGLFMFNLKVNLAEHELKKALNASKPYLSTKSHKVNLSLGTFLLVTGLPRKTAINAL